VLVVTPQAQIATGLLFGPTVYSIHWSSYICRVRRPRHPVQLRHFVDIWLLFRDLISDLNRVRAMSCSLSAGPLNRLWCILCLTHAVWKLWSWKISWTCAKTGGWVEPHLLLYCL